MKKKGSLELSINAIVVIIIAITMLGLGLTFMKTLFGKVTDDMLKVSDTIQQDMVNRFKDNTKQVELYLTEYEIRRGGETKTYLAIKNTLEEEITFFISCSLCKTTDIDKIDWSTIGPTLIPVPPATDPVRVLATSPITDDDLISDSVSDCMPTESDDCKGITIETLGTRTIPPGEVLTQVVKIKVGSGTKPDDYKVPINVYGYLEDGTEMDKVVELDITVPN